MENPLVYLPMDRRHVLAHGQTLSDRAQGATLFADISGFTPLTEALVRELGPQRGAEELTRYLNLVYDAVIEEVHHYGGSVIAFAGDAITCWFDGDIGLRATVCALAMQTAMHQFAAVITPAGNAIALAMKTAVAAGSVRRFLVGDPTSRVIDALAGQTLVRLANAEHQAQRGETVVDGDTLAAFANLVEVSELRHTLDSHQTVGVVTGLRQPHTAGFYAAPWPPLAPDALSNEQIRTWLLPQVYERLRHGLGSFLAELRPTVALFLRFAGIDYDHDDEAGIKLDTYIRWVLAVVARYEGTLLDLNIGDKGSYIYINFGAPLAHEDNADRAAAAALVLCDHPDQLNYIGQVQIGISQGRMRAGAYGGINHRTYGVLGDEVNMAARLMMVASPGQILVSAAAQRSMGKGFLLEELPPIRIKGKSEPATIFALTGTRSAQQFRLRTLTYALPMVGRQEELSIVTTKLAQAAQGQGQIVSIMGEAGLGKSRLIAEILQRAIEQHGFRVYGAECESYGINSSYLVWQPIWREIFRIDVTWPLPQQLRGLERKLRQIHPLLLARLPLLGPLFHLDIADNAVTQSLDAKLRKTLLEALLVDCLRTEARQAPLLIVLEACQWLDPLSTDLLAALGEAIAQAPVILLLGHRPGEPERLGTRLNPLPYHTLLALSPLTLEEAAQLLHMKLTTLLGDATAVPVNFLERITAQAEGNPFYLEELINYLHYRKIDFHNSTALEQVELPDSLQRLVLSHVDQLSESQKITLKVASVIGRIFRAAWLYGVYPELGNPEQIQMDLETLHQQELMLREPVEPELVYLFRQVVTQSATYESLPHTLKAMLHEQIGSFIEQSYPDALDQYLDLLAYHYDHSTNVAKQRYYLRKAGETAQANYANRVAIRYFERLLPLLTDAERGEILLRVGEVFDTIGDYAQADACFQAALRQAEQQTDQRLQAQCQIALGELCRKQSRYDEAARYFTQAQTLAEQIDDQTGVAKALICAGSLALYQGDYPAAQAFYLQSLAIRRHLGDQPNVANVLNNMAITAANEGNLAQAYTLFAESLAIRRSLGDKWGVANSLNNLGELALLQEIYGEARLHLEEAVTIYREIGDQWSLGNSVLTLGNVLRAQGSYAAAHALYQESLQIYRELGDRRALAYLLESIGGLLSLQGEAAQAFHLAGAADALREILNTPLSLAEQSQLNQALDPARQRLGSAVTTAWEMGRALSLEQAIGEALSNRT